MKALGVAVCIVLMSSSARAQTAGEMLQACEILQRGMHIEGETVYIPPSSEANQCWGFIEAIQEYSVLVGLNGKTLLGACPDPDGKSTQVLRILITYANAHPDELTSSAAAVAYEAMIDAFPCKRKGTGG